MNDDKNTKIVYETETIAMLKQKMQQWNTKKYLLLEETWKI